MNEKKLMRAELVEMISAMRQNEGVSPEVMEELTAGAQL